MSDDLIGIRQGNLVVLKTVGKHNRVLQCRCDCGKIRDISLSAFSRFRSCGCEAHSGRVAIDLVGQRFGMWMVLKYGGSSKFLCRCDCGTERLVKSQSLRNGLSKSCGCNTLGKAYAMSSRFRRHGKSHTRVYRIWQGIKNRCHNLNDLGYRAYGARGILVCNEWRNSFEAFYLEMGDPPTTRHTIDRIDPDGNYEPGNCRWATFQQQSTNKKTTKRIMYSGETKSLAEWAREFGLNYGSLWSRINRGKSFEDAIAKPSYIVHNADNEDLLSRDLDWICEKIKECASENTIDRIISEATKQKRNLKTKKLEAVE